MERSELELLKLLLKCSYDKKYMNYPINRPAAGLCDLIFSMKYAGIITNSESIKLLWYIYNNVDTRKRRLMEYNSIVASVNHINPNFGYYWQPNKWRPRRRWLRQEIKRHEDMDFLKQVVRIGGIVYNAVSEIISDNKSSK
jgi:hypothetical protein